MDEAKWVCLTDNKFEPDTRKPYLIRYDKITSVEIADNEEGDTIVGLINGESNYVRESVRDVFCAPVCDTPLLALQKWEENG